MSIDSNVKKILENLGFENPEDEPLTETELRRIFIIMHEGLCAS
jgi:hypothetical protein